MWAHRKISHVNDMLTEDVRDDLWPFNEEAFEAELESKMVRDEECLFRKKHEPGENLPTERALTPK